MGVAGKSWYLAEWATLGGKRQADLMRERGWSKARTSKVWNGVQPWTRDDVIELAAWLGIAPYELLMPPAEAKALNQLRDSARAIAESGQVASSTRRTGTDG